MKYQKGHPGGPGRKKGVGNLKKLAKVSQILIEKGINPVDEMLKLIPQLSPKDQTASWQYLHSFVETKPKEIAEEPVVEEVSNADILELVSVNK